MYHAPTWATVSGGADAPPARGRGEEPADPLRGWQRVAVRASDERTCELHLANLSPASRALLLSQAGQFAARAIPYSPPRNRNLGGGSRCAPPISGTLFVRVGGVLEIGGDSPGQGHEGRVQGYM